MSKTVYQESIIKRFMTVEELERFDKTYKANRRQTAATNRVVNDRDRKIAEDYKNGSSLKELCLEYKTTSWKILHSIALASR